MPPTDGVADLRLKMTDAGAVIVELSCLVAEPRKQVEAQQAHIHRLVKMTFGRAGDRVEDRVMVAQHLRQRDPAPTHPWSYLSVGLDQLAAPSAGADVGDLVPDSREFRDTRTG